MHMQTSRDLQTDSYEMLLYVVLRTNWSLAHQSLWITYLRENSQSMYVFILKYFINIHLLTAVKGMFRTVCL